MIDPQLGEVLAVHENDSRVDGVRVLGWRLEVDLVMMKTPLVRALAVQRAHALLYIWPAHRVRPSLCLDVDQIQPELVFLNHAVDAAVQLRPRRPAESVRNRRSPSSSAGEDELFEEFRRLFADSIEQVRSQRAARTRATQPQCAPSAYPQIASGVTGMEVVPPVFDPSWTPASCERNWRYSSKALRVRRTLVRQRQSPRELRTPGVRCDRPHDEANRSEPPL